MSELHGMASEAQLKKIREFTSSPNFKIPIVQFLKSVTGGTVISVDELTHSQAEEVLAVFKKFKKSKV